MDELKPRITPDDFIIPAAGGDVGDVSAAIEQAKLDRSAHQRKRPWLEEPVSRMADNYLALPVAQPGESVFDPETLKLIRRSPTYEELKEQGFPPAVGYQHQLLIPGTTPDNDKYFPRMPTPRVMDIQRNGCAYRFSYDPKASCLAEKPVPSFEDSHLNATLSGRCDGNGVDGDAPANILFKQRLPEHRPAEDTAWQLRLDLERDAETQESKER